MLTNLRSHKNQLINRIVEVPVEGTYRQVGSVVIVDESGEIDFEKAATQPVELLPQESEPISATIVIMNNFSICKGEPSRDETLQFSLQSMASSSTTFEQLLQQSFGSSSDIDMNQVLQHVSMNFLNGIGDFSSSVNDTEINSCSNASSSAALMSTALTVRNSSKTLKCPKCNWHYKYQETLEIHMKEKHSDNEASKH
ncbi:unnamed protein product [Enterobius vermicularis]|uniref:C2H2-type domain-containing protein n=1 Tax=Enterobius vermicularis TaxID=51028 RepID=A0A0N4VM46_ENTVE|nr:unnamed protein product [Enterobius vermicularis]